MNRKAIVLTAGVLIAACALVLRPTFVTRGYSQDGTYADCTYYPSHKEMFLSNDARREREVGRISLRLKKFPSLPVKAAQMQPRNFIDWAILTKMNYDGVAPAPMSTDEEFLRRAYLDVTGRIPNPDDVRAFLADNGPNKRDALIEKLLQTPEYADRWANFLGDLLQVTSTNTQGVNLYQGRNTWYDYIKKSLADGKPYSEFATDMIAAATTDTNTSFENGPSNFIVRWRQGNGPIQDTYDNLAEAVARDFMGLNINCISCHDGAGHTNSINLFLTSETRRDFWGMAAYFSKIQGINTERLYDPQNPNNNNLYRWKIIDNPTREYTLNTSNGNKQPRVGSKPNETVKPLFILSGEAPAQGESYRAALARHVTGNRQFARATANYVWKELFGLGIVEPADSFDMMRISSKSTLPEGWTLQATHPDLLEALADDFINSGYDFRNLIETIMKSATYQLSSRYDGEWSDKYIPYFARKFPRRLKAEELHDAIVKSTNYPPNPPFQVQYMSVTPPTPPATQLTVSFRNETYYWAMQLSDTASNFPGNNGSSRDFLNTFLRGNRDAIPRSSESSLTQELNMYNNTFLTSRVKNTTVTINGTPYPTTVASLLKKNLAPADLVNELYLATLSRRPSPEEQAAGVAYITGNKRTLAIGLEDLQFVLLNKVDFIFNY
ncbi:MAG TPA: DUF1549 domain-containing protein [Acidobacteriota bacterium]